MEAFGGPSCLGTMLDFPPKFPHNAKANQSGTVTPSLAHNHFIPQINHLNTSVNGLVFASEMDHKKDVTSGLNRNTFLKVILFLSLLHCARRQPCPA